MAGRAAGVCERAARLCARGAGRFAVIVVL